MDVRDLVTSLSKTRAERYAALAELGRDWGGSIRAEGGYPDEELRAAEARLGFALPAALREAYLLFGRKIELACGLDTLRPPHWLEVQDGLLMIVAMGDTWGIAEADLALEDPPVHRRAKRGGSHPVHEVDASLSHFLVREALLRVAEAGRYTNQASKVPVAATIAELSRSHAPLSVDRARRLYVADRSIVTVDEGRRELTLTAPDRESYRAAVAFLGELRWAWTEEEARRRAFHVHAERFAAQLAAVPEANATMQKMVSAAQQRASACRAAPARPAPLDPRLAELVTRAFRPYEGLLPPAAAAYFVEAAGWALDVYPTLDAWTNAFLGKPKADDVAQPRRAPDASMDQLVETMEGEAREMLEGMLAAGVADRMRAWVGPRMGASGARARGGGVDHVLLDAAEQAMQRFLSSVPTRPPAEPSAVERELFHTVRLMMACMLARVAAGVPLVACAGFAKACEPYRRATDAVASYDADSLVFRNYFQVTGKEMRVLRDRLGASEDDAYDRLRAFLEGLATTIESSEEVADLRKAGSSLANVERRTFGRPPRRRPGKG